MNNVLSGWKKRDDYDNSETTRDLDIKWRFHRDYIVESAESLIEKGFIK